MKTISFVISDPSRAAEVAGGLRRRCLNVTAVRPGDPPRIDVLVSDRDGEAAWTFIRQVDPGARPADG